MLPHVPVAVIPGRLWRLVALASAALVLLLSLSSVSPALHGWLHEAPSAKAVPVCPHHGVAHAATGESLPAPHSDGDERHECAVTLFAHGVVQATAALLAPPSVDVLRATNCRALERLALSPVRYLHLPPHAPPAV